MSDQEKSKFRLHNLGYVFQDYALLPELNAMENVYISLMMQGKSKAEYESAAAAVLAAVGLGDRLAAASFQNERWPAAASFHSQSPCPLSKSPFCRRALRQPGLSDFKRSS